ncbi:MAG: nitroreductase family protein [Fibrobacteraceae bacterium]|nr:nitroreductase family protein [Fibrobacteraceae bacterium]
MSFMDLVKTRYSCRKFSAKAVEEEKLSLVLEAGRLAPTATNAQPVHVFALKSEDSIAKVRSLTRMAYDAPIVLMVCYDKSESYKAVKHDGYECGDMDASIVTTTMMMEATELGLATLWARGFLASEIEKAFGLPENMKLVCLLDVGYADEKLGGPSPRHFVRKPMNEFVKEA